MAARFIRVVHDVRRPGEWSRLLGALAALCLALGPAHAGRGARRPRVVVSEGALTILGEDLAMGNKNYVNGWAMVLD